MALHVLVGVSILKSGHSDPLNAPSIGYISTIDIHFWWKLS